MPESVTKLESWELQGGFYFLVMLSFGKKRLLPFLTLLIVLILLTLLLKYAQLNIHRL